MNKIISTTGAPIEFNLTSSRSVVIDPVTPIEVSDEELTLLQERLGNQISAVSREDTDTTVSSEPVPETEPVAVPEAEPEAVPEAEPEAVPEA